MNGAQDLGGAHGFGPVLRESDEPVFHHPWERRAFAVTLALGMLGRWNIDMSRYYRENRHPVDYLSSTYYEIWLKGVERLAVDHGLISEDELRSGRALAPRDPAIVPPDAARARELLVKSVGAKLSVPIAAHFAPGDRVRVKNLHPATHTRMPRDRSRRVHFPGHARARAWPEAAALLQRALHRARALGRAEARRRACRPLG
jgi:nitrile hydratase beta subunit